MKKIFLPAIIALLFSTACLILSPPIESTPTTNSPTTLKNQPTLELSTPLIVPRPATRTPNPTATVDLAPHWKLTPPNPTDRSIYKDDLAPEYQAVLDNLPYASAYAINFIIANDLSHISGHETVTYFNAEDVPLKEIKFHLFPNILDGKMSVENVTVNEKPADIFYASDNSLLILRLKKVLKIQESLTISMDFKVTVAQSLGSHYSVQTNYDHILALAHAYPMIAVYDSNGWNTEVPVQYGDLTYSDVAFYVVTVEAPDRVTLVASGREINREESANRQRVIYAAGPARDFFLAASPDYSVLTKEWNGVELKFYALKSQAEGAAYALDAAANALEIFSKRYAPYPYRELDIAITSTTAGGMEYPGAVAIARQYIIPNNMVLESVIAHEVGHQWFYNLVGNNQLAEPWLDESLTQFVTLQYFMDMYSETGRDTFRGDLESRWGAIKDKPMPIDLPVASYTEAEYRGIIYGRGALFFEALRDKMSAKVFDDFMRDYVESNVWDISTTARLREIAENHCACNLNEIFQNWVYP